ncbi:MAG TPA: hypothetical protein VF384_20415 [Planctomycetota bacterium]
MFNPHVRATSLLAFVSLLATACGGGSAVSNASPRISAVPLQYTAGGSVFSLDLANYVTDRESSALTYAVTSGVGSFADSTFSASFPTMGEHTVGYSVSDGEKVSDGAFVVRVTSANLAVVREDSSGLLLLDSATNAFVRVTGASVPPSLATGLTDGRLVYQLAGPTGLQLWVFDPMTRISTRVAGTATGDVTYRAKTSDNRLVYTTGSANDMTLFFYNPVSGLSREIAQGALATLTVLVSVDDIVFYEAAFEGQADVLGYDPGDDASFTVGTAATDEQIQAVLPNGAVVFTRVGAGGEDDLFYFKVSSGLVEIGSDQVLLDTRDKTFRASGSASQVVFTATDGATVDLHFWNPDNGQTTTIASGGVDMFAAIGAGNEVVYRRVVSATEEDAFFYDLDDATAATVRNGADVSAVLGVTGDGTTSWAIVRGSGALSSMLAVSLVGAPSTQVWTSGGPLAASIGVLGNGDVVAQRDDGAELDVFDVSAGTWGAPITGAGLSFAGAGLDAGDFVYAVLAGGQTDLSMWDASVSSSVVVSDAAGNDAYATLTADGTILFTRVVTGNTNADLFVWDGATTTRLTDQDEIGQFHDHSVLGKYSGSR